MKSYLNNPKLPRGVRNNNPGNLRIGAAWKGRVKGTDTAFVTFESYAWGVRAMILLLANKYKQGQTTVRKLISSWAPPVENHTNSYVRHVAKALSVGPDDILSLTKENMFRLTSAIAAKESGPKWALSRDDFEDGYSLFKGKLPEVAAAGAGLGLAVATVLIAFKLFS